MDTADGKTLNAARRGGATLPAVLLALLLGGLNACGVDPVQSRVYRVYPSTIPSFGRTQLTLEGLFVAQWGASPETGAVVQNVDFSAWVQPLADDGSPAAAAAAIALEDVAYVDETTLTAWTPDGLEGGAYAVLVQDPRGHPALVDDSVRIEVNPSTPDHVVFLPDEKQWLSASSTLTLNMVAVDDKNLPYPIAGRVVVTVASPGILVTETTLDGAEDVEYADGQATVAGYLSASGEATLTIACEDPSTCTALPPFLVTVHAPADWPGASTLGSVEVEVVESYSALQVTLPDAPNSDLLPYTVVAGEPFRVNIVARGLNDTGEEDSGDPPEVHGEVLLFDVYGVVEYTGELPDNPRGCFASAPIVLQNGTWSGTVTCYVALDNDKLYAVGPLQKWGQSREFDVVPADAARLQVDTEFLGTGVAPASSRVVAGTPFWIQLTPLDPFGNPTAFPGGGEPEVDDVAGSLACAQPFDPDTRLISDCTIERAIEGDVIRARADGVQGESRPFDVVAGDLARIAFAPLTPSITAGQLFLVSLWTADQYGNPVGEGNGSVTIRDDPEDPGATPELGAGVSALLVNGAASVDLQLKRAVSQTRLIARFGDYEGESSPFAIVAGPAVSFDVQVHETVVTAGEPQVATVRAEDLYHNPVAAYTGTHELVLAPLDTQLEGDTEPSATFQEGVAYVSFVPIQASEAAWLVVGDTAGVSGTSNPFTVVAREEVAGFAFLDLPAVVWKDEPFPVTIRAVDKYGNHVVNYASPVRLDDATQSLEGVDGTDYRPGGVVELTDGAFDGTFIVSSIATNDMLLVTDDIHQLESSSDPFPVYDLTCSDPPATTLSVGGRGNVAVACEGDPVQFSATGESDYGITDVVWTFDDGTVAHGGRVWDTQHAYLAARPYAPAVSAVDRRLCASWVTAKVYVGVHDGSPTGPMTMRVVSGDEPLIAGADDGSQIATVELQATDCREDVASYVKSGGDEGGFQVTVVTSLGDLEVGDVSEDPGMQYRLNPYTGSVQFSYSVGNVSYGGDARIVAAYLGQDDSGERFELARGSLSLRVENDRVPPYVVDYYPAGTTFNATDSVSVGFSEPIRADNLTTPEVLEDVNHGEDPIVEVLVASWNAPLTYERWPIDAISLDETGRTLIVHLAGVIDLERQRYQVQVLLSSAEGGPTITDQDGNPLDGDWDGTHVEDPETGLWEDGFSWRFGRGDMGIEPQALADCSVSLPVFSPDGQDGPGEQADSVVFEGQVGLTTPIRAIDVVIDFAGDGRRVASLWYPVAGEPAQVGFRIAWDGTGLDGQRLWNGDYIYRVNVIDTNDNWMRDVCVGQVEIRNPVDLGEDL